MDKPLKAINMATAIKLANPQSPVTLTPITPSEDAVCKRDVNKGKGRRV